MIKEAIAALVSGKSLTADEAASVMSEIMQGEVTPAQFGAFVTALKMKGETVPEITGLARAMRARATTINTSGPLVDTCGTGGDYSNTFNISTTVAFVVAGAGLKVAKHGNRAMSSQCGSADVLEALGIKVDLNAEQVGKCIEHVGIGFMFAPVFHPATKFASQLRREVGVRTIFNILGPLTNPAHASSQLMGVADPALVQKLAMVLLELGCHHALVVHGEDGLDEITITAGSQICEVKDGSVGTYTVQPEDFGFTPAGMDDLKGGTSHENAAILRKVLSGQPGPQRNVVLMNAAAALLAGDMVAGLAEGVALAKVSIDSGQAMTKLEQLIKVSRELAGTAV